MGKTTIEWTDRTWNPTRGCSMAKGSEKGGCLNCYAAAIAARFTGQDGREEKFAIFKGFARRTENGPRWTGKVELVEEHLLDPLKWRKPQRIFVNSMSDLFHESLSVDDIEHVWATMLEADHHFYQILTKRAERMSLIVPQLLGRMRLVWETLKFENPKRYKGDLKWPLPHVQLGVSVENQATADTRIPWLLKTPAAVRNVSYEPALEPVDFRRWLTVTRERPHMLDQIIIGGESGPGARPFDIHWAGETIRQCKAAGVSCFVKQLGAKPMYRSHGDNDPKHLFNGLQPLYCNGEPLKDRKGGDMAEWPQDLRVRESPRAH